MTIWPTIGATAPGRWVGQLSGLRLGWGFFTLGKLLALATIPLSLAVFCWQLMPGVCRRYVLTNRRVLVKRGLKPAEERAVRLDGFDAIDVRFFPAKTGCTPASWSFGATAARFFASPAFLSPKVFRQVCLKARRALLSFREATAQQPA